jgi:hypothetical protein
MLLKYDKSYSEIAAAINVKNIGVPLSKEELLERTNPHFLKNIFEKFFEYQGGLFDTDDT